MSSTLKRTRNLDYDTLHVLVKKLQAEDQRRVGIRNAVLLGDCFINIIRPFFNDRDSVRMAYTYRDMHHLYLQCPDRLRHMITAKKLLLASATTSTHFYIQTVFYSYIDKVALTSLDFKRLNLLTRPSLETLCVENITRHSFDENGTWNLAIPDFSSVKHLFILSHVNNNGSSYKRNLPEFLSLNSTSIMTSIFTYLRNHLCTLSIQALFTMDMLPWVYSYLMKNDDVFTSLTTLSILMKSAHDHKLWSMLLPRFPMLLSLTVQYSDDHTEDVVEHLNFVRIFTLSCDSLTRLTFHAINSWDHNSLYLLGSFASTHCEELHFINCRFHLFNQSFDKNLFVMNYTRLHHFALQSCLFSPEIPFVFPPILYTHLKYLDLNASNLSDECLKELISQIPASTILEYMDLSQNIMGSNTFRFLLKNLEAKLPNIKHLCVRNNFIGQKGLKFYLQLLNEAYANAISSSDTDDSSSSSLDDETNMQTLRQMMSVHLSTSRNEEYMDDDDPARILMSLIRSTISLIQLFVYGKNDIHTLSLTPEAYNREPTRSL